MQNYGSCCVYDKKVRASLKSTQSKIHLSPRKRECLLTRLPRLKCIGLGSVRSSHLPFRIYYVGFRAFESTYINAYRVNSNILKKYLPVSCILNPWFG